MRLITAISKNGGIGLNNKLPWRCPDELVLFKQLTMNKTLIMGRKTVENLPLLKGRKILCLTNNKHKFKPRINGNDITFIDELPNISCDNTLIAGGSEVYRHALEKPEYISGIFLSQMKGVYDVDAYFPKCNLSNFLVKEITKYPDFTHYYMERETNLESQYIDLLNTIREQSNVRETRNDKVYSLFNSNLTFDLREGFPLLTTKKMFYKGIIGEFLFFLRGDTDSSILSKQNIKIWEANSTKEFHEKNGLSYKEGLIGPMYGYQWRFFNSDYHSISGKPLSKGFDQFAGVIQKIKDDPYSRRLIMTSYNPLQAKNGVLFPCHSLIIQFYCEDDFIDMFCYNRSQDVFLGVPFNIASSAILLEVVANMTGRKARKLHMSMGDVHMYQNHLSSVCEQVSKYRFKSPRLSINRKITIDNIDTISYADFELCDYSSHHSIKAKMVA